MSNFKEEISYWENHLALGKGTKGDGGHELEPDLTNLLKEFTIIINRMYMSELHKE